MVMKLCTFSVCHRISYSDFVKTFSHLEVVHLDSDTSRDEPSLHHKNTWQMRLYQGAWQRGVSAGGCRNNPGEAFSSPVLTIVQSQYMKILCSREFVMGLHDIRSYSWSKLGKTQPGNQLKRDSNPLPLDHTSGTFNY